MTFTIIGNESHCARLKITLRDVRRACRSAYCGRRPLEDLLRDPPHRIHILKQHMHWGCRIGTCGLRSRTLRCNAALRSLKPAAEDLGSRLRASSWFGNTTRFEGRANALHGPSFASSLLSMSHLSTRSLTISLVCRADTLLQRRSLQSARKALSAGRQLKLDHSVHGTTFLGRRVTNEDRLAFAQQTPDRGSAIR